MSITPEGSVHRHSLILPGGARKSVSAGSQAAGAAENCVSRLGPLSSPPRPPPCPRGQTKQRRKEATPRPARKSANEGAPGGLGAGLSECSGTGGHRAFRLEEPGTALSPGEAPGALAALPPLLLPLPSAQGLLLRALGTYLLNELKRLVAVLGQCPQEKA